MTSCAGCGIPLPPPKAPSPPRKWCSERCRRRTLYTGECVDCGAQTYHGSMPPPERCVACTARGRRIWTKETVIGAVQAWARENGEPPTATDWNPPRAISLGYPEKAEKFYAEDAWPHVSSVQRCFGSWNAAIHAAGFECWAPGKYGRDGEDMELCREIRVRYEAGERPSELAAAYDCTPTAVHFRVLKAGGSLRPRSEAQRLRWAA